MLYKFNPHTLEYVVAKEKSRLITLALCATIFLIVGFSSAVKVNTVLEKVPVVFSRSDEQCNDVNVKAYIDRLHLKFPKVVYQQIIVESGHFTSPIFKTMNNLAGMQVSYGRPTIGRSIGERFAQYDNWKESLVDYALWQASYARDIQTEDEYYYFLDRIYCERDSLGTRYSTRLKQINL